MFRQVQLHKPGLDSNTLIGYLAFMTMRTLKNKSSSRKENRLIFFSSNSA